MSSFFLEFLAPFLMKSHSCSSPQALLVAPLRVPLPALALHPFHTLPQPPAVEGAPSWGASGRS